ncbi:regulatory protein RecX [Candidatus Omnitrophota bacterium]
MKRSSLERQARAKAYSFLLLKFRQRSVKELSARLKKKFDAQTAREVVRFLKKKDFIDDSRFARDWIASRLKKPLGLKRIRRELKIKGISEKIIDLQLEPLQDSYSEEDVIFGLACKRFKLLKGVETVKAKRRLFGYLARRGFSYSGIINAIKNL